METSDIYLLLKSVCGLTDNMIDKIERNIGNIDKLLYFSEKEINNLQNINLNIKENIVKYRSRAYLENVKESLYKKSVKYICINSEFYPENLRNIYNPPKILFYKGDINLINNKFNLAMVGSRKPTAYGKNCAKIISQQLSEVGIGIISGLALGIDSYSHLGCLDGDSKTIAVLGSGVDNPLPKQNTYLADKILNDGGLLISEYNIDSKVFPYNFSNRNRIISGLSEGIVVIEAAQKSGAIITVDYALEQGKTVFAVPGNIMSEMSRGCHKIIKEGAKLIENVDDILSEYNLITTNKLENNKNCDNIVLNANFKKVLQIIRKEGNLHIDKICDYTGIEIKYINSILNELELRDLVVEVNNKTYSLNL